MRRPTLITFIYLICVAFADVAAAEAPEFFRGINLNGPPVTIDGRMWEGNDAKDFSSNGKSFENQKVNLIPATDADRAKMIRSSLWGVAASFGHQHRAHTQRLRHTGQAAYASGASRSPRFAC